MLLVGHVRSFSDRPIRVRCWGKRNFEVRRSAYGGRQDYPGSSTERGFLATRRERQDKLAKDRR
jgi:hypothetical protein